MRVGLPLTSMSSPSSGATYRVRWLQCNYFRNFFFRVTVSGGTYTISMHDTQANAAANTDPLAVGTHAAGQAVQCAMAGGGGSWNPGGQVVEVEASGTWTGAIVLGYVDNPETYLLDAVQTTLQNYQGTHESLLLATSAIPIQIGLVPPSGGLPIIAIGPSRSTQVRELNPNQFEMRAGFDVYVWGYCLQEKASLTSVMNIASMLRSILFDEQRTFSSWVTSTSQGSPIEMGVVQHPTADEFLYQAMLSVEYQLVDLWASVAYSVATGSGGGGTGGGGKYRDILQA